MSTQPRFATYAEAQAHQMSEWLEGRPWHNPWGPDGSYGEERHDGECCPDFSCCRPDLIWPKARRLAFASASEADRHHMLLGALSTLTRDHGATVLGEE
jgi:hypothetical protein